MVVLPKGDWRAQQGDLLRGRRLLPPVGALAALVSSFAAGSRRMLNVFRALLYLGPRFVFYYMFFFMIYLRSRLPVRDKERIICRAAWRTGCRYEYVHHARRAARCGVSGAQVRAFCRETLPDDAADRVRAQAVDALTAGYQLPRAVLARLRGLYSDREIVDLTLLIGHYMMVAAFNNSLVSLEADADYEMEGAAVC